jgi:hypothetical protein
MTAQARPRPEINPVGSSWRLPALSRGERRQNLQALKIAESGPRSINVIGLKPAVMCGRRVPVRGSTCGAIEVGNPSAFNTVPL